MEVIRKGEYLDQKFIATCTKCKSVVEAKRSELSVVRDKSYFEEESAKADCIVCGEVDGLRFILKGMDYCWDS